MRVAQGIGASQPPVTTQDLSALPVVVGIFVQKMMDQPAQRSIIRDKLADYVLRESQGSMSIGAARTLNRILADLELAPVRVPEAAAVGPLEEMVRQHRSIDQVWDGTRYLPMPEADRVAREWAMNQVISEIKNLGVPFPSLTEREQYEAREILSRALRALGPSPTV